MMKTPDTAESAKAPKPSPEEVDAHKAARNTAAKEGKTFAGQGREVKK